MITTHATRRVTIPVGNAALYGDLNWPIGPGRVHGLTVIAHANSGSRLNPRHQALAAALNRAGLATLLTDLLTTDEDQWDASAVRARYDVDLLTGRLHAVSDRLALMEVEVAALPVAFLGTGTTAAAALRAAAERSAGRPAGTTSPAPPRAGHVDAVVSRSGRPDLAGDALHSAGVPVLFLVAEHDRDANDLHRRAGVTEGGDLREVPGCTDLVGDGTAVEAVAHIAGAWLVQHLDPQPGPIAGDAPAPTRTATRV
jgi:putative phosphoribosyl transferase